MPCPPIVLPVYFLLKLNQGGTSLGNTRLSRDKGRDVLLVSRPLSSLPGYYTHFTSEQKIRGFLSKKMEWP